MSQQGYVYDWGNAVVEEAEAPHELEYLEWDKSLKNFVDKGYSLQRICLQPSNRCEVHGDELQYCGLDPYEANFNGAEWRIDSETGHCMSTGWMYEMGEAYIADETRAEALCQRLWGQSIEEAYKDSEENHDGEGFFYTEWE